MSNDLVVSDSNRDPVNVIGPDPRPFTISLGPDPRPFTISPDPHPLAADGLDPHLLVPDGLDPDLFAADGLDPDPLAADGLDPYPLAIDSHVPGLGPDLLSPDSYIPDQLAADGLDRDTDGPSPDSGTGPDPVIGVRDRPDDGASTRVVGLLVHGGRHRAGGDAGHVMRTYIGHLPDAGPRVVS